MSQSERSRVPPVTADRSPPASRTTGADSPVTALSSTDAIPATISPSAGRISPASTRKRSSLRNAVDETTSTFDSALCTSFAGPRNFFAGVSCRALRSDSACALPRPSATASEKFANRTVNHSQSAIAPMNPVGASPCPSESLDPQCGGQYAPNFHNEHDRVAHHRARVKFHKGFHDRALVDLAAICGLFFRLSSHS